MQNRNLEYPSPGWLIIYCPEIDELRAIAVLSVVFLNLGAADVQVDFIGVAIFFDIFGFPVSSLAAIWMGSAISCIWLWPVLILSKDWRDSHGNSSETPVWVLLPLILALLSWRFVYHPVRRSRRIISGRLFSLWSRLYAERCSGIRGVRSLYFGNNHLTNYGEIRQRAPFQLSHTSQNHAGQP